MRSGVRVDKQAILGLLRERADRPLRPKEIARALQIERGEYPKFKQLLRELEDSGEVYRVRKKRYALPQRINLVVGRLQLTRAGHGFVIPDDGRDDVVFLLTQETGGSTQCN